MSEELAMKTPRGILGEILKTPVYKDILRLNLNEVRPYGGSEAVKTLMTADPEVFLGLMGSLGVLVNTLVSAFAELAVQLKDKYPPELLRSFLESLYDGIDKDLARQCARDWAGLGASLWAASPEMRRLSAEYLLTSFPRIKAGAINGLARLVNSLEDKSPGVLSAFVAEVLRNVDGQEAGRAAGVLAGAFLDQKWHLASWAWRLARTRVKKRLFAIWDRHLGRCGS